jgi:lysophospholipase L1-like esterase
MATARKKRAVFALAAMLVSATAMLAVAELGSRLLSPTYRRMHDPPRPFLVRHPTRGFALKPGYDSTETWGLRFRVNRLGFRGPEVSRDKPAGTDRVLIVGDSIAMGAALPEETLVSADLERMLRAARPDRTIEVINSGVGGYDIEEEKRLLLDDGLALTPDAVVLIVCLNDIPGTVISDHVNPLRDLPVPGKRWLIAHSALALVIQDLYDRFGLRSGGPPSWLAPDAATEARIDGGWDKYEAALGEMAAACHGIGAPLVVVLVPHAAQFDDPNHRFIPQHRLAEICRRLDLVFIDPAPQFAAASPLPYSLPDPVHPNPQGHQIIADLVAPLLPAP